MSRECVRGRNGIRLHGTDRQEQAEKVVDGGEQAEGGEEGGAGREVRGELERGAAAAAVEGLVQRDEVPLFALWFDLISWK